jgi:dihydroxy-acid dehydratase
VRTGDKITVDVEHRILSMDVSDAELEARSQTPASEAAYANPARGWEKLYVDHVMQADTGADLDFLVGSSGSKVSRESH